MFRKVPFYNKIFEGKKKGGGWEGGNSDQRIVFNSIKRHKFTVKLNNVYVHNHDIKAPQKFTTSFCPKGTSLFRHVLSDHSMETQEIKYIFDCT